jgi:metal-responsive CopG/Arc/MetJ family transcriptional regulator
MVDINRGERLQIMLTEEEVKALDDWRFAKRMPSRASAIRELLRQGLAAEGVSIAGTGSKSKDFGVILTKPKAGTGNGRAKTGG